MVHLVSLTSTVVFRLSLLWLNLLRLGGFDVKLILFGSLITCSGDRFFLWHPWSTAVGFIGSISYAVRPGFLWALGSPETLLYPFSRCWLYYLDKHFCGCVPHSDWSFNVSCCPPLRTVKTKSWCRRGQGHTPWMFEQARWGMQHSDQRSSKPDIPKEVPTALCEVSSCWQWHGDSMATGLLNDTEFWKTGGCQQAGTKV